MSKQLCPCGSKQKYTQCCGLYFSNKAMPETAVALMRSRYTAYCLGNIDYLVDTLHPSRRKFDDRIMLANTIKNTKWLSLKIIDVSQGQKNDLIGYVEFIATYQTNKRGQLHERSQFIKDSDRWFYTEAQWIT
jgi:SEC-C motif domain protein